MRTEQSAVQPNQRCDRCGSPLDQFAPEGVCPTCMLKAAFLPGRTAGDDNPETSAAQPGLFSPAARVDLGRFGDYELLEEIAHGGMGVVYRARQLSLNRIVAVKMLLLGRFSSADSIQRFQREAKAAASLEHANIVAVHEVGSIEGQHFFSMDYVEGRSLAVVIRQSPLPARAAATYCRSMAEAIAYAHARGIIHRDLKPSNVLIDIFDQVRITDFGLAKPLDGSGDLTLSGHLLGSPNYLPPELALGLETEASILSEVYSLGAILYECLTGRPPFLAESIQATLIKIRECEVARPRLLQPNLSRDLETICLKALEKNPAKRYGSARELADELGRFLRGEPIQARAVTSVERGWRWCRRKPALASLAVATTLLLLAILIGFPIAFFRIKHSRKRAEAGELTALLNLKRAEAGESTALLNLKRAEAGELTAQLNQYASDMNLANQAVAEGDFFRAVHFLEDHRPKETFATQDKSSRDLRGWEWYYLWQQSQGEPQTILGYHADGATAAGFLPDGKTAYSAGNDRMVRLWDIESKKQVGLLEHESAITGCACSLDGRWLATSSDVIPGQRSTLRLWDLQNRNESTVLTTNFWIRPTSIVFAPDGKKLAFVENDFGVHLWNLTPQREITHMKAYFPSQGTLGIAFSPDSRTLAYAESDEGNIVLWDVPTESRKGLLKGHSNYVNNLAFTPDGQTLASSSVDKTAKLWRLGEGGEQVSLTNFNLNAEYLRISPDGTVLATTSRDRLQRFLLQEIPSGVTIRELIGHRDVLSDAGFAPDGKTIITSSRDSTVRLWPVRSAPKQQESRRYGGTISKEGGGSGIALRPSPDGRNLLVVYANETFTIWDTLGLSEGARQAVPVVGFQCAALSAGAQTAAFVGEGGKVVLWHNDLRTSEEFCLPKPDSSTRAAFSPDSRRLAIGSQHDVWIFDVSSKTLLSNFHFRDEGAVLDDIVMSLSFSGNSEKLIAGFYYGKVRVWELTNGTDEVIIQAHTRQVRGLAILPDNETVVSAGPEVRLWNLRSQREIDSFQPRADSYYGCSISPDGRRLAVGARDGMITIWDLESRREVITLKGHQRAVFDLFFLADSDTMISIGQDEVRVWRAPALGNVTRSASAPF